MSRRGSNDFRGSAFVYDRDHHLAAYPGFRRAPRVPAPSFARRQTGASGGGRIVRDRLFWFANDERNHQDGSLQVSLIGEVFNVFNIANLTGESGVLNQPGYGQPSARVWQVFGTGAPRAFQFAARVLF